MTKKEEVTKQAGRSREGDKKVRQKARREYVTESVIPETWNLIFSSETIHMVSDRTNFYLSYIDGYNESKETDGLMISKTSLTDGDKILSLVQAVAALIAMICVSTPMVTI